MKRILLLFFFACSMQLQAQNQITGLVKDDTGEALVGAGIVVKGTTVGVITDLDGKYSISVPDNGSTLVFSHMSTETKEIAIAGKSVIDMVLKTTATTLDDVVVTALGIKREKKALGYAMQEVKTDGFLEVKTATVSNMLQGKVAGVNISQSSSGVGGSTRIIMRGLNSLTGNNQPLWVVDGIPIRNDSSAEFGDYSGTDAAGAASEINPDDIESLSVLKGPNAAALYGSRAQSGVVIVTTKGAKQGQALSVNYNGNYTLVQMYEGYDFQWKYGQGTAGVFNIDSKAGWGPEMKGQKIDNWRNHFYGREVDGYAMQGQKDRLKDFFRTGYSASNSISIEGGGANLASRFSFTDMSTQGITTNNKLKRQYFDSNSNYKYGRLTVNLKATYSRQTTDNPVALGEYGMMQMFTKMPANIRTEDLLDNMDINDIPMNWSGPSVEYVNPYNYVSDKRKSEQKKDRLMGVISANYKVLDWLSVNARIGLDHIQNTSTSYGIKSASGQNPAYFKSYGTISENNSDLMLNMNKVVDKFSITSNVGVARMKSTHEGLGGTSGPLVLYGLKRLSNGSDIYASDYLVEKEVQSVLGNFLLGYNNYLYLDITMRNDWSSTLPSQNRSYFYPSASLSGIISQMLTMPEQISFLKVRGSWAKVGKDTDAYRLSSSYSLDKMNGDIKYADIGSVKTFDNIKPEETTSAEIGFDIRMFKNRIGLDFTYYNSNTTNQILSIATPPSSGYGYKLINAGKMKSSGLEIMLNTTPVETKNFRWDLNLNWGTNKSECVELSPSVSKHVLGALRIGEVVVMEGEKYGNIRSKAYIRDAQGRRIIDDNGLPTRTNEYETIGNISPDWVGSISNRLQYKDFVLSALVDIRYGGDILSVTDAFATAAGTSERTLEGREGMILDGVTSTGQANTKQITAEQYWQSVGAAYGVGEEFIYDGTYVKLREISLGYNIPQQLIAKTGFIKKAKLSVVARDLFYLYKKTPGTDPEGASINADWAQGFELNSLPPTRSFGFNLSLTF